MNARPFDSRKRVDRASRFEKCCVVSACAPPSCHPRKRSFHARQTLTHLKVLYEAAIHQCAHPLADCQPIGRTRSAPELTIFVLRRPLELPMLSRRIRFLIAGDSTET